MISRKPLERVIIDGGRIVVTLVSIGHGKSRLGFECDQSITVDREEVHKKKLAEAESKPQAAS